MTRSTDRARVVDGRRRTTTLDSVGDERTGSAAAVDALSTTFAALADPTRRAIIARLAQGDVTVKELSEPFTVSPQAVSRHLRVLERAGLITRTRSAQWRLCRLRAAPLGEIAAWVDRYRSFWDLAATAAEAIWIPPGRRGTS